MFQHLGWSFGALELHHLSRSGVATVDVSCSGSIPRMASKSAVYGASSNFGLSLLGELSSFTLGYTHNIWGNLDG